MKIYSDERLTYSRTYNETTPESVENGDFSDTGIVFSNYDAMVDLFIEEAEEFLDKESAPWFSTGFNTTCYKTGTEREECLHLSRAATPRMKLIWTAVATGMYEFIDVDDDDYDPDERNKGLPVSFEFIDEFNKVQTNLNLDS